jgi:hypothetical protein
MKKIFFFTAIAFLMLSSCKKEATTLAKDQTSLQSQLQTNASGSQLQKTQVTTEVLRWLVMSLK